MTHGVIGVEQGFRHKVQAAIADPFSPGLSLDEIWEMLGGSRILSFDEIREGYLQSAPPFARNFYKNLRTPEGAQKFVQLLQWYPQSTGRLLNTLRQFIPFILPSDEWTARVEYDLKAQERKNELFTRSLQLFSSLEGHRAQRRQEWAETLISKANRAGSWFDLNAVYQELWKFTGTPYFENIVTAITTNGARLYRQNPAEGEVYLQNFPADVVSSIKNIASTHTKYQQIWLSLVDERVRYGRNLLRAAEEFGLKLPVLEASVEAAEKVMDVLREAPMEEFDRRVEMLLRKISDDIVNSMKAFETKVDKMVRDLIQQVGSLLTAVGTGSKEYVSSSLSSLRTYTGMVGGKTVEQIMTDPQGRVTFSSWLQILDETEDRLTRMITKLDELGVYPTEALKVLVDRVRAVKNTVGASSRMFENVQQILGTPEFRSLLSKSTMQNLDKRLKELGIQYKIQQLEKLRTDMQEGKFKSQFDAIRQFFNGTLSLLRILKQYRDEKGSVSGLLSSSENIKVIKNALSMANVIKDPLINNVLGPDLRRRITDEISKQLDTALQGLERETLSPDERKEYGAVVDNLLDKLIPILLQAHSQMESLLRNQGYLPTQDALPEEVLQMGGVPYYMMQPQMGAGASAPAIIVTDPKTGKPTVFTGDPAFLGIGGVPTEEPTETATKETKAQKPKTGERKTSTADKAKQEIPRWERGGRLRLTTPEQTETRQTGRTETGAERKTFWQTFWERFKERFRQPYIPKLR